MEIYPVAHIENDFKEKFGIPNQSGITAGMLSRVVFEEGYRDPQALRGIDGFSHIWLIWEFSKNRSRGFSPTVRPPALGGNERMGVFATRSPNRPNPIGMSSVRLVEAVTEGPGAPYLTVAGADLMDGTPIYDIKPYIRRDCHPEAHEGFNSVQRPRLSVSFLEGGEGLDMLSPEEAGRIREVLSFDPRPAYQEDPERVYGMRFGEYNFRFRIEGTSLTLISAERADEQEETWERE